MDNFSNGQTMTLYCTIEIENAKESNFVILHSKTDAAIYKYVFVAIYNLDDLQLYVHVPISTMRM